MRITSMGHRLRVPFRALTPALSPAAGERGWGALTPAPLPRRGGEGLG